MCCAPAASDPIRLDVRGDGQLATTIAAGLEVTAVLDPRVVRLRRLAISEAERFPDLARGLWEQGPQRAVAALAAHLDALHDAGHLRIPDTRRAAQELNWLHVSHPGNNSYKYGQRLVNTNGKVNVQIRSVRWVTTHC